MMADEGISRKQERFLQGLLLGKSIVDAAKFAEISEPTATRWLKNPLIQSERKRRETELAEAEQAEIQRILTSGYAAIHNRVQDLDRMARLIEQSWHDAEDRETIIWAWLTPDKLREWRGCLDDIAKELGQRVKVSKSDVTSAGEKVAGPQVVFYLPEVDREEDENTGDSESSSCS